MAFVTVGVAVPEGAAQGGAGLLDAPAAEVSGAVVDAPVALGGVGLGGQEMQLRFHGSQYGQGV